MVVKFKINSVVYFVFSESKILIKQIFSLNGIRIFKYLYFQETQSECI
jgi:hypothetical protein